MELNEALKKLDLLQRKQIAYGHAMSMINYDGDTVAPRGSAANRAETLGILSEETYKLSTCEETIALLDELNDRKEELDPKHRRIVEVMHKDIENTRKIPMDEYIAYQKLSVEAADVWHKAKEENDYPLFMPYLEKLIDFSRRFAHYTRPEMPVYDALLDQYEKGLTREKCDQFFDTLRRELVPLIHQIASCKQVDDAFLTGHFPLDKQRELSDYLMRVMGIDRAHCGIGETEHPFTTGFTKYDVRITTHYYEDNFASSMYSVIHEGGHALYDLHPADDLAYTVLGGGVSMSIHESQSRFYENIIGRSYEFVKLIAPKLRELFPELSSHSDEALYKAFNKAQPSLIRTESDELHYCMHIMVRYELEQKLMDGTLSVEELPREWNRLYKEYLGVDVPSDKEGVLQDVHWAGGMFGYFPSYALGSAYGAQLLSVMKDSVDINTAIESGDLTPINRWLEENIWKYGALHEPGDLLEKALGQEFDPMYFVRYLKEKFSAIYNL